MWPLQLPEAVQIAVAAAVPGRALALVALRQQGPHHRQDQDHRGHRAGAARGHHLLRAGPGLRPGTNCIKIGLPGKLMLSKRKGLPEDLFS